MYRRDLLRAVAALPLTESVAKQLAKAKER